jgi:hypothetical protein
MSSSFFQNNTFNVSRNVYSSAWNLLNSSCSVGFSIFFFLLFFFSCFSSYFLSFILFLFCFVYFISSQWFIHFLFLSLQQHLKEYNDTPQQHLWWCVVFLFPSSAIITLDRCLFAECTCAP